MALLEPTITVRVKGAVPVVDPTVSCSPDGLVLNVSATVRGWISTLVLLCTPRLSVAVSRSSRCAGYS